VDPIVTVLRKLTVDDLNHWFGDRIVDRGKAYVKRVHDLSRTDDDTLVAWVTGTERYATSVRPNGTESFQHTCTCPYPWGSCKHVVAVILAAADRIRNGKCIPPLAPDHDFRQAFPADLEEDEPIGDERKGGSVNSPRRRIRKARADVAEILGGKSRNELSNLLLDLSGRFPQVRRHIVETEALAHGRVDELVRTLHSEIQSLTDEPVWYNAWSGEGSLPDLSQVDDRLRALADAGHGDEVLALGEELWVRGNAQVAQSNDEGETGMAIATCLEIVLSALPRSSLPPPQQLLWVIEKVLDDEYGLLGGARQFLDRRCYTRTHWRETAETLERQLEAIPKPRTPDFSSAYRRNRLLSEVLHAYTRAGWKDRVIPRLEVEADACRCYARLVDELLAVGDTKRARQWCIRGYANTVDEAPGTAAALQERLRMMAQQTREYDLVAAYRAQDFIRFPSRATYSELRKAAKKAKCWPTVREAVLRYLDTGKLPQPSGDREGNRAWPLPPPEVEPPRPGSRNVRSRFPDLNVLIEIAIMEARPNDVVELYHRLHKSTRRDGRTGVAVAQAVADTHPEVALAIWADTVTGLIDQVKPSAYEIAARHLRAMRKVYERIHRLDGWHALLDDLKRKHKAKRRLLAILDTLSTR
jgi:uncharacterized Zn finger protein